jgi:hypothetical protein
VKIYFTTDQHIIYIYVLCHCSGVTHMCAGGGRSDAPHPACPPEPGQSAPPPNSRWSGYRFHEQVKGSQVRAGWLVFRRIALCRASNAAHLSIVGRIHCGLRMECSYWSAMATLVALYPVRHPNVSRQCFVNCFCYQIYS